MKLSKVLLLAVCGTALAFLPRRSSRRQTLTDNFDNHTASNPNNGSNSVSADLNDNVSTQNRHQSDNAPNNP